MKGKTNNIYHRRVCLQRVENGDHHGLPPSMICHDHDHHQAYEPFSTSILSVNTCRLFDCECIHQDWPSFSYDVFEEYSRDSRLAGTGQLFVHLDETKPFWFTSPSCPCCHKSRIDCSGRFFVIVRGYQTKFLSKTVRKICEKGSRQLSYIMDGWWMDENLFYHVLEDEPLCPR